MPRDLCTLGAGLGGATLGLARTVASGNGPRLNELADADGVAKLGVETD
ncbi:MAG: hypothetical protein HS104_21775 [Polyangiaceae bacterium]|nr:hypothetical protein [Polyangiaceae bacterium]MCL4753012.1 hypothetical protein [Myxococcales bacterium]